MSQAIVSLFCHPQHSKQCIFIAILGLACPDMHLLYNFLYLIGTSDILLSIDIFCSSVNSIFESFRKKEALLHLVFVFLRKRNKNQSRLKSLTFPLILQRIGCVSIREGPLCILRKTGRHYQAATAHPPGLTRKTHAAESGKAAQRILEIYNSIPVEVHHRVSGQPIIR